LQTGRSVAAMDRKLKLTLGAIGALAAAVGVAAVTIAATGRGVGDSAQSSGQAAIALTGPDAEPSPAASPGPAAAGSPAARAARAAVVTAEAEVLGLKPRDLAAELRQGTTLHRIADQRGISQVDFQARYTTRLTAVLDQQVRAGNLTAAQEQQALQRLGTLPNWDQPAAAQS
jgi:hypothetical protein